MDARTSIAEYAKRLVSSDGIKALLLDHHTSRVLAVAVSQSWLLERDVVLIEKLDESNDAHPDLDAIVFVRPTSENVLQLRKELRSPRFASYQLAFSNVLRRTLVEELADADAHERVTSVTELYADFFALSPHLVSLGVVPCLDAMRGSRAALANPHFERTVDGVTAILLALKVRPIVRYERGSSLCRNLAERVSVRIDQEAALFSFGPRDRSPLLLIVDRREDPLTPLLNQWTYEAMTHELVGLKDNIVDLRNAPAVPKEMHQVVLNADSDEFYAANRYANFGDLGDNLNSLVQTFQQSSASKHKMESVQDMIALVAEFPQLRQKSVAVGRHVALASELSRITRETRLMEVSQLEQDLACREAETDHIREVEALLHSSKVSASDKLRVVMLYALRYEDSNHRGLGPMKDALHRAGVPSEGVALIDAVKVYAGSRKRSSDVFNNRSFFAKASNSVRRGIGGVENVYTQHEPLLMSKLDALLRGRMRADEFPSFGHDSTDDIAAPSFLGVSAQNSTSTISFVAVPRQIIVLMAGGTTHAESRCVSSLNGSIDSFVPPEGSTTASAAAAAKQIGASIVLVGSSVHNSTSFAVEIGRNASLAHQHDERDRTF